MTRDQINAIPRPTAQGLFGASAAAIEDAINIEWWRGYYAAMDQRDAVDRMSAALLQGRSP